MSIRSLRRQLEKLEAALPPPSPPPEEFPIEEWLDERMREAIPEANLKNSNDEEHFYHWLEKLGRDVVIDLYMELDPTVPLPEELLARLFDALPPHVERYRRAWAENFPSRQHRRLWMAENQARYYPNVERTEANGYGWWLRWQEECARLGSVYAGFESEWAAFYESWQEECEQTGEPMSEEMREEFVGICFMREEREQLLLPRDLTPADIREFYEDSSE